MQFNRAPENSNQYKRDKRACFGCEAGKARSLATPGKESADLRANRPGVLLLRSAVLLRLRSKLSVFHSYPVLFSKLKPQFSYHAPDFTFMEDTNVFEKGCLFHSGLNVGCLLVSRVAAGCDSHRRCRLCSDACGRHAPTTGATAARGGKRASG